MRIPNIIRRIDGKIIRGYDPFPPDPKLPRTDPSHQDRQFNSNPKVSRISQGEFYVEDVVDKPTEYHSIHYLSADCEYCHKTIQIRLHAPKNAAKYVMEEACRLGMLGHLRTEHPTTKKK